LHAASEAGIKLLHAVNILSLAAAGLQSPIQAYITFSPPVVYIPVCV
jgi:hypothetical protein